MNRQVRPRSLLIGQRWLQGNAEPIIVRSKDDVSRNLHFKCLIHLTSSFDSQTDDSVELHMDPSIVSFNCASVRVWSLSVTRLTLRVNSSCLF